MGFAAPDDPVAKGPVTRCLDELSVGYEARRRLTELHRALTGLAATQFSGLEKVFATHLFPGFYPPDQIDRITEHLRTAWFSPDTGWWPSFQPIAPIYGLGLVQTLNASLAATGDPLAIDSYWVMEHTRVEMVNLVSPRQVTLLIATPRPAHGSPPGIQGESSEVWVTARRAGRTQEEVDPVSRQLAHAGADLRVRTFKISSRPRGA